jgi:hypothetical protein
MGTWWVRGSDGRTIGPVDDDAIAGALGAGQVGRDAWLCPVGGTEWAPLGSVAPFAGHPALAPPTASAAPGAGATAAIARATARSAPLARARAWLWVTAAAALLPLALAIDARARSESYRVLWVGWTSVALPALCFAAAATSLAAALSTGAHRLASRAIAAAAVVAATAIVLTEVVASLTPIQGAISTPTLGALRAIATPAALGGVAFLLAARGAAGARAWAPAIVFALLGVGLGRVDAIDVAPLAAVGLPARALLQALVYLALAAFPQVALRSAGPTAEAAPTDWADTVSGLRGLALALRVRAFALGLLVLAAADALRERGPHAATSAALAAAAVIALTGPWLTRAVLALRRAPAASGVRGPATIALVLLALRVFPNGLLVVFAFTQAGRSLPSSSDGTFAGLVLLGSVLLATLADSALLVCAARAASGLGASVRTGASQLLVWGATVAWLVTSSGVVTATADGGRRGAEIATLAIAALTLGRLVVSFVVSGALLRASRLDAPLEAPAEARS